MRESELSFEKNTSFLNIINRKKWNEEEFLENLIYR
jgi:hypothetical protein